ncbi:hypothetical protein PGTUg99_012490, partial [Puccinia graminis f. sp. tritici]
HLELEAAERRPFRRSVLHAYLIHSRHILYIPTAPVLEGKIVHVSPRDQADPAGAARAIFAASFSGDFRWALAGGYKHLSTSSRTLLKESGKAKPDYTNVTIGTTDKLFRMMLSVSATQMFVIHIPIRLDPDGQLVTGLAKMALPAASECAFRGYVISSSGTLHYSRERGSVQRIVQEPQDSKYYVTESEYDW